MKFIDCIPVEEHPEHPKDQSPCKKEECPWCNKQMWVSEKKKALHRKAGISLLCFRCILNNFDPNDLNTIDISRFKFMSKRPN